jgi:hypothetical protein
MSKLEINYIAPISNYIFPTSNKYYLVISYMKLPNDIIMHKLEITMNNTNELVRAYHINKLIEVEDITKFSVQIFQHDLNNKLTLLFTNIINPSVFESNKMNPLTLYAPPTTFTLQKTSTYKNDLSFLSEQFYNYESLLPLNQCLIFLTKSPNSIFPKIPQTIIFTKSLPSNVSYNKYHQIFTSPISPNDSIFTNDYIKYVTHYQIDIRKYVPKISSNFKDMFLRKIDLSQRLPSHSPYLNNVIVCPTDCSNVKIESKNSFSCALSPSDYPRIYLPYQGYLVDIKKKSLNGRMCYILNFTNSYFIPKSVSEREYISVVYGHNVQMSRAYPELVDVQPDTSLYFDIVLIGSNDDESILITNKQLENFMGIENKKLLWFDQGMELCGFNNCVGSMVMKFNRNIEFDKEIRNDCGNFIKLNDIIGYIQ